MKNLKNPKILLDMDGVLTNLVKGVADLLEIDYWDLYQKLMDEYDIPKVLAYNKKDFWGLIDNAGSEFWSNLEGYPWWNYLPKHLSEIAEVYICTSPSVSPNCAKGKVEWIQRRYGKWFREFIITPQKHLLANRNTILIDDHEKNTSKFFSHGGNVVLFPHPWNGLIMQDNMEKADYVIRQVRQIINNS